MEKITAYFVIFLVWSLIVTPISYLCGKLLAILLSDCSYFVSSIISLIVGVVIFYMSVYLLNALIGEK